MYHKLGISPCYEKANRTHVTLSSTGNSSISAFVPSFSEQLRSLREIYPVNVSLYDPRLIKLTTLVDLVQRTDIFIVDVSDELWDMIFLRTNSVIIVIDENCEKREAFHRAYRKLSQELTLQYVVISKQNISIMAHGYDSFIHPYLSFISNKYVVDCNVS